MSSKRQGTGRKESDAAAEAGSGHAGSAESPRIDDIRVRAYEIYLERGEQPGREQDDWLEAERQLKSGVSGRGLR
jgi:hypothetical protein